MGDVNLEIKLNNLDERVTELEKTGGGGESYITSVNDDFNVINKKLSLSERITTKLSKLEDTIEDNADWLKSKNIFDGTITHFGVNGSDPTILEGNEILSATCKVEPGKTYTISRGIASNRFIIVFTKTYPKAGDTSYNFIDGGSETKATFTVPNDCNYVIVFLSWLPTDTYTAEQIISAIQVEEGEVATPYKPYSKSNVELTKELAEMDFTKKFSCASMTELQEVFDKVSVQEPFMISIGVELGTLLLGQERVFVGYATKPTADWMDMAVSNGGLDYLYTCRVGKNASTYNKRTRTSMTSF